MLNLINAGIIILVEKVETDSDDLMEMATLRKKRSGLPVNLYLDDSMSYKGGGHGKRIKFQPDKGDRPITRNMVPMSISDNPEILEKNVKISISNSDINKIKNFVKLNKDNLLDLSDMKIDFQDFLDRMKK
jgi:hypothetical protein